MSVTRPSEIETRGCGGFGAERPVPGRLFMTKIRYRDHAFGRPSESFFSIFESATRFEWQNSSSREKI